MGKVIVNKETEEILQSMGSSKIEELLEAYGMHYNLLKELILVYNSHTDTEEYADLEDAEKSKVANLFFQICQAFSTDVPCWGIKVDYQTAMDHKKKALKLFKTFDQFYISWELYKWFDNFKKSQVWQSMNGKFERKNFKYRFKCLIKFFRDLVNE